MAAECPICGCVTLEERKGEYRFELPQSVSGKAVVIDDATWEKCTTCGEEILPPEVYRRLEIERRKQSGLLSPDEIRGVRERVGLSQEAIARLLGLGLKTYARWESGQSVQNRANDNLIRLFDEHQTLFVELEVRRTPERKKLIQEYLNSLDSLEGSNQMAIAAHGADLDFTTMGALRNRLLQIVTEGQKSNG